MIRIRMRLSRSFAAGLVAVVLIAGRARCGQAADPAPDLKKAETAAATYYLSLPRRWTADRAWPILVTIEGSGHNFLGNCQSFIQARGDGPFIIVTPCVSSNGNDPADARAVLAIAREVQQAGHGQAKFFLTGFSAGGHVAWQIIFAHPELLAGAAPAAGNYRGRGVNTISDAPERVQVPIHAFQGDRDPHLTALNEQWDSASALAREHGYQNIIRTMVPGAGHSAFPEQVIEFCSGVLSQVQTVRSPG